MEARDQVGAIPGDEARALVGQQSVHQAQGHLVTQLQVVGQCQAVLCACNEGCSGSGVSPGPALRWPLYVTSHVSGVQARE